MHVYPHTADVTLPLSTVIFCAGLPAATVQRDLPGQPAERGEADE